MMFIILFSPHIMLLYKNKNTTKQNTYDKKCKHITKRLYQMYLFKQTTLSDGVIDAKEIDQWRQILNEYEESLKEISSQKT